MNTLRGESLLLDGKVAIVTGGASGLGEAIAAEFAAQGASMVIADINLSGAMEIAAEISKSHAPAIGVRADVRSESSVAAMVAAAIGAFGRIDILVCSAAVETRASVVDCTDEDWAEVLDVDLKGPFLCMKHAVPAMIDVGGGSIIAMGSTLGHLGQPKFAAYCAAKGALVNLCKQVAIEHAPDKIRVNVLSPSACEAGLFLRVAQESGDPEGVKAMVSSNTPMKRLGTADDVVQAALYLASERSSFVSGAVLPLDGGMAARRC